MSVINLKFEQDIKKSIDGFNRSFNNVNIIESGNLFNKDTITGGYYVSKDDGQIRPLSGYGVSDFIPVDRKIYPTLKFMSRVSISQESIPYNNYAAFYDQNRQYLSAAAFSAIDGSNPSQGICEIPENAWYIRVTFSWRNDRYFNVLLYYGNKTLGWLDVSYKPVGYKSEVTNNLISKNDIVEGFRLSANGSIGFVAAITGEAATGLIKVKPNTTYITSMYYSSSNYYTALYVFDENKQYVQDVYPSQMINGIFTTPANACYIARNYYVIDNKFGVDYRDKPFFLYELNNFNFEIGSKIAENEDYTARITSTIKEDNVFANYRIIGLYENYVVRQLYNGSTLYFSDNGMESVGTAIEINTTNFPDIITTGIMYTVSHILFFNTNKGIRCLIFFHGNQIYCSTTGVFSGFEKPNIWDLKGNKYWKINADTTDKSPSGTRYRKHYPSDLNSEDRKIAFMWHNGPVWTDGLGGQYSRGVLFANYTDAYATTPSPSCLFYTEDGKNIYVQYEFGVYQKKYKLAGDDTEKSSVNYGLGDDVTPSSMSGSLTNVTIKKRWNILPTESIPHPEEADTTSGSERAAKIFDYSEAVTVNSISGEQFVLSDASNFNIGDTVVLQGTATEDFAKMLNNEASDTEGGNAVFVVKSKSGNNITLADAIGNPKNNLMCRHIHGIAEFGNGICIYTGEEYPESWYIYIAPYIADNADNINMENNRWETSVVRLNSSKNALQRALGVYLRPDGKMIYVADSAQPFIKKVEALGVDIKMNSHGVYVTDISGIDNPTGNISKIGALNAIYCLYKLGSILFISDYHGNTYYSKDEGDSWKFICRDGTLKNTLVGFDKYHRRFVFNTERGKQFVLEIK